MIAMLPENARSECVAPRTFPVGGVVESMRMFQAACAASHRPALSPTRGSGDGVVPDTIGSTGFGITAGGGGGGGGGVPRPPRPAAPAGVSTVGTIDVTVAVSPCGVAAAGGGVLGAAAGGGVDGAAAGAAAGWLGVVAGAGAFLSELAHANHPNAIAANNSACVFLITSDPPASRAFS